MGRGGNCIVTDASVVVSWTDERWSIEREKAKKDEKREPEEGGMY